MFIKTKLPKEITQKSMLLFFLEESRPYAAKGLKVKGFIVPPNDYERLQIEVASMKKPLMAYGFEFYKME